MTSDSAMSSSVDDFLSSVLEGIEPAPLATAGLPKECFAETCHVVQLRGVYDPHSTDTESEAFAVIQVEKSIALSMSYSWSLQSDLLLECCKVGKVKAFVVPDSPSLEGSVLVSYEEASSARACAESFRDIHGKEAEVFSPPSEPSEPTLDAACADDDDPGGEMKPVTDQPVMTTTTEGAEDLAAGVDDFLNSLL